MSKTLIVYTTRTGGTKAIADLIAEGIRISGEEAAIKDVENIQNESDLAGFDAYVFGSPTYHGEMLPPMKKLLFMAEKAGLEGKAGGAFGAFGWSGEAPDRIYETMKNIFKMEMVSDPLRLKDASLEGGLQMAHDYGKQVVAKIR